MRRATLRVGVVLALIWAALGVAAATQAEPAAASLDCSGYPCLMSFTELDSWTPSSVDPRQMASVPLAPRVGAPTPKSVVGLDFTDFNYNPDADGSTQGGPIHNLYTFGHWQQTDIAYYFKHSLVSVPPVVWTNAAHRNGVQMLGVVEADFLDGKARFEELFNDENVDRTVDQLTSMARTFAFDGWIIDVENGAEPTDELIGAIGELRSRGLVIGYYEAGVCNLSHVEDHPLALDAVNASDFWQSDYPCMASEFPEGTYDLLTSQSEGLDRWDAYNAASLYASENQGESPPCALGELTNGVACNRLGSPSELGDQHSFFGRLGFDVDEDAPGGFWGSLGVFAPGWPAYGGSGGFPIRPSLDDWRPLDDRIWGGSSPPVGPDCSTAANDGLARWLPPRPPVVALPFTTTFNRGFAESFSVLGAPVQTSGWNHIGMEDAVPSWLCRTAGTPGEVDVSLLDGPTWNGGTALAVTGSLPAGGEAEWGLWAASLQLPSPGDEAPVVLVRTSGTGPTPWLALWFADGGTQRVPLEVTGSGADANGWTEARADLGAFTGRTVSRVGLGLGNGGPEVAQVDLRVGSLTLALPSQMEPLDLVEPTDSGSKLTWEQPPGAVSANVWAHLASDRYAFLGPSYAPVYETAQALFAPPSGEVVVGYVVQPVNAAGAVTTLGAPTYGELIPVSQADPALPPKFTG